MSQSGTPRLNSATRSWTMASPVRLGRTSGTTLPGSRLNEKAKRLDSTDDAASGRSTEAKT